MFLLSAQNNSYIEFMCRRASGKKISLNFMSLVGFQASKIWMFSAEQALKSFSGRNKYLEAPVFGFCDSLRFGLEESRELRALI